MELVRFSGESPICYVLIALRAMLLAALTPMSSAAVSLEGPTSADGITRPRQPHGSAPLPATDAVDGDVQLVQATSPGTVGAVGTDGAVAVP